MKHQKGFTLIELLIALAIVLLVAAMAAVAVNSARAKQRDAVRLSSVRQMQSAFEDYFNERNSYPAGMALPLGDGVLSVCLTTEGFFGNCAGAQAIMRVVPATYARGLEDMVKCGTPAREAFCYSQAQEGQSYKMEFELENALPAVGLVEGANCATPEGMKGGRCS